MKEIRLRFAALVCRLFYGIEAWAENIADEWTLCETCGKRKYYDPPCFGEKP